MNKTKLLPGIRYKIQVESRRGSWQTIMTVAESDGWKSMRIVKSID